jgi:hypothetical protein
MLEQDDVVIRSTRAVRCVSVGVFLLCDNFGVGFVLLERVHSSKFSGNPLPWMLDRRAVAADSSVAPSVKSVSALLQKYEPVDNLFSRDNHTSMQQQGPIVLHQCRRIWVWRREGSRVCGSVVSLAPYREEGDR